MCSSDLKKGKLREQSRSAEMASSHALRGSAPRCLYSSAIATVLLATVLACSNAFAASEQVLWNFGLNNGAGRAPNGGLITDPSGNLFGTTFEGGNNGFAFVAASE